MRAKFDPHNPGPPRTGTDPSRTISVPNEIHALATYLEPTLDNGHQRSLVRNDQLGAPTRHRHAFISRGEAGWAFQDQNDSI